MAFLLTPEQIEAAKANVFQHDNKLTASEVSDLVSIFRGFLGVLADNYTLESTLTAEQDTENGALRCVKLAACLALFQDNQFTPKSGFASGTGNRTGFNYSMDGEVYEIFKYAFGLFWPIPRELEIARLSINRLATPQQGPFDSRGM